MQPKESLPRPFGPYELLEELGRGTTGIVYKSRFRLADRIQVIKLSIDGQSVRAAREVQLLAYLTSGPTSTGIVRIYDAGVADSQWYIGREYVDGSDLAMHLRTHRTPLQTTAAVVASVARTIRMVNDSGIQHGNLTPENVLIPVHGEPKLIGFGSARGIGLPATHVAYSDIQALGKLPATHASYSDIQALGKLLVSAANMTNQVLPEVLEAITMKCKAAGSDWGYRSAGDVADALDRYRHG